MSTADNSTAGNSTDDETVGGATPPGPGDDAAGDDDGRGDGRDRGGGREGDLLARRRRQAGAARGGGRRSRWHLARYYVPVVVVALAVAAVVIVRGGGESDDAEPAGLGNARREDLVRAGPLTPERAELLGEDVASIDFGPRCDRDTGRIMMPTVYAPPCVVPFTGDNGGATAPGVTADTVRIVAYQPDLSADQLQSQAVAEAGVDREAETRVEALERYIALYDRLYETYGRRVELETYTATGPAGDHEAARADAIAIAEREPFAVIGGPQEASYTFADELAARGVVCLEGCAVGLNEAFLDEHAPYVWMGGTVEQSVQALADMVGALAGPGPAEMAGDRDLRGRERVYGVVHYNTPDGFYGDAYRVLRDRLADHGVEVAEDIEYVLDQNRVQENARGMIARLEAAGVTTVVFVGDPLTPAALTQEATAQDYHPEWIHGAGYLVDSSLFARTFDQEQWSHGFGLANRPPAADDLAVPNRIYEWAYGEPPPTNIVNVLEPALRTLYTGIHLAGPELTPETFRDGLLRYPPSGGGPTQPRLSYDYRTGGGGAVVWWDPEAEGVADGEEGRGMYRYAAGGRRYGLGDFPDSPAEAGLFDEAESVVVYDELPPEDQTPEYDPPV